MRYNPVVILLLVSDLLIISGFGLLDPILAVFINDSVPGATLATVGIASGIFLVVKSLIQVPFSKLVDRYSDKFDTRWLFIGTALVSVTPLIYLVADKVEWIYLAQVVNGLGAGIAYPSWLGLWSTHLDKGKESFEWSFYSTITGLAAAAAAPIGAYVVEQTSFQAIFVLMFCFAMTGSLLILFLGRSGISLARRRRRR